MILEIIEYMAFAVILAGQFVFFFRTRKKIAEFNHSIAEISSIYIADLKLTERQVNSFSSRADIFEIAKGPEKLDLEYADQEEEPAEETMIKIKLVESANNKSVVFNNILNSLNKYLLRNRHSVADFSLIKDIVERNTDTVEEEVNLTLSTPLYLGLMGTMLGVVIGIFSMSSVIGGGATESADAIGKGISILLGSVKVAMIASFVGLLLTIYNSAVTFKGSKYKLESKKNDFYTMIQVELLPSLNQGMNATFDSLQRNLFKFNEKFDTNLDRLSTVFDKNYDSILMQKQLLELMDSSKVGEITQYNVDVLREMRTSMAQFGKFNSLFSNINGYIENSYKLTEQSTQLLQRTGNFESIAMTIQENLNDNKKLVHFLSSHFNDLETHKAKVDEAIVKISFSIQDTFNQLNTSLQHSSEALSLEAVSRNIDSKALFEAFSNDLKVSFADQAKSVGEVMEEKKSSLDYLKHLEALLNEVKAMKNSHAGTEKLYSQVLELNSSMTTSNLTLQRIESDVRKPFFKKIFHKLQA
ncbi:hypothetical protein [Pedobacter gandavensis]|uniref:hypothetical protein n=1 Tax=Pedobacter gandavensis TaxID=2679963 RepID=UPI00292E9E9E|nr:hypothetical protein [Pedobacter gandavensis]